MGYYGDEDMRFRGVYYFDISTAYSVTIHSRPVQWLRPSIFEGYVRAANS